MKKLFLGFLSLALAVIMTFGAPLSVSALSADEFVPVLRFVAATDVHVKEEGCIELERLAKLFDSAYAYADAQPYDKIDAFVFSGDSVNSGTQEQWTLFNDVVKGKIREESQFLMSYSKNHEHWSIFNSMPSEITGVKAFNSVDINGFRFITVPQDRYLNYLASRLWLRCVLAKAAAEDSEKPIFVFQHEHIMGTVYGSDSWGTFLLTDILMRYPQVVDFSGHSHYPVNDPRSVHQKYFTSFGSGTLSYFELEDGMVYGSVPPQANQAAQFYIVEVSADNEVRVMPYNLLTDSFFENPGSYDDSQLIYTIKNPSDRSSFTYTAARFDSADAPAFPAGAEISFDDIGSAQAKMTFTQALDGENIHSYRIELSAEGKTEQDFKIWSEFYFQPISAELSYTLDDLTPGRQYTVSVTAIDSYGKTSASKLTGSFVAQ